MKSDTVENIIGVVMFIFIVLPNLIGVVAAWFSR
jgi:hypothetical protein